MTTKYVGGDSEDACKTIDIVGPVAFSLTYIETYSPDYFLRLIFDRAGQLKGWKEFAK